MRTEKAMKEVGREIIDLLESHQCTMEENRLILIMLRDTLEEVIHQKVG